MKNFEKFHFRGQYKNEEIIQIVRRHWFDILQQFFIVFAMIFVLAISLFTMPVFFTSFQSKSSYFLFLFLENTFLIMIWLYSFLLWIDYYFDVWIITNKRIVNVEQKGLFVRHISELKFSKIQDISTEIEGVIPTILNYGEVHVQTAGTANRFIFRQVADPHKIKETISKLQSQERKIRRIKKIKG